MAAKEGWFKVRCSHELGNRSYLWPLHCVGDATAREFAATSAKRTALRVEGKRRSQRAIT